MDVSRRELPALLLVVAAVVSLATVGAAWRPTTPLGEDLPAFVPVRGLTHWDSGWYAAIARDGYFYRPGQQSSIAFFPLLRRPAQVSVIWQRSAQAARWE